jgi:hypothetical protein
MITEDNRVEGGRYRRMDINAKQKKRKKRGHVRETDVMMCRQKFVNYRGLVCLARIKIDGKPVMDGKSQVRCRAAQRRMRGRKESRL